MPTYAALLRAINVGGTGKLPMSELKALAEQCGFTDVTTYIQSGNLVFKTKLGPQRAQQALADALERKLKKPVGVMLRTHAELRAIHAANPFSGAEPNRVVVMFLDEAPDEGAVRAITVPGGEELALRGRELFIYFPDGQGKSKLKTPFDRLGTGRNLNTVQKLVELTAA